MEQEKSLSKLPEGWIWTTIGEIGIVTSGGTPSTRNPLFWGGNVPWVTPADLSNFKNIYIEKGARNITEVGLEYSSAKLLPKGSILFSSRAPIGYVAIAKNDLATNQGFKSIIPTKSLFSEYVFYYLKTLKPLAEKMASGTTFLELSASKFVQLPIPLPPLKEQQRIVAKIEELFSELDNAEAGLKKAKKQLEIYRQSLLKSAFEGKLTEKWREENPEIDAFSQLSQIKQERDFLPKEKGSKISSEFSFKRSKTISSWAIATLNNLIGINARIGWRGLTKDEYTIEGTLFLSVHSLNYGKTVVFNNANHISLERYEESPEIKLQINDILLCKDGAGIGKVGIIKYLPDNATVNSSLLVIRAMDAFIPDFLYYLFTGPSMQKIVFEKISGSAIPHLFQKDIKNFSLQVPPKEEQAQIVQELETIFTLINELELSIDKGLRKTQIFRHAILKKAFEGKLVPQFTHEEYAEKLLNKIKIEKEIYLIEKKTIESQKPKKVKIMETEKSILEILQESSNPILAKDLWIYSKHKDNIEDFYDELKEIYYLVKEVKKDTESFISLNI